MLDACLFIPTFEPKQDILLYTVEATLIFPGICFWNHSTVNPTNGCDYESLQSPIGSLRTIKTSLFGFHYHLMVVFPLLLSCMSFKNPCLSHQGLEFTFTCCFRLDSGGASMWRWFIAGVKRRRQAVATMAQSSRHCLNL